MVVVQSSLPTAVFETSVRLPRLRRADSGSVIRVHHVNPDAGRASLMHFLALFTVELI